VTFRENRHFAQPSGLAASTVLILTVMPPLTLMTARLAQPAAARRCFNDRLTNGVGLALLPKRGDARRGAIREIFHSHFCGVVPAGRLLRRQG
jgi:hypothetical protein